MSRLVAMVAGNSIVAVLQRMRQLPHAEQGLACLTSDDEPDIGSGRAEGVNEMPRTTPETVQRENFGPVEVGTADLDGYTVNFLHFTARVEMSQMLRGLPGDICHCPHWGVVTDGTMIVRYVDHQESVEAGDVFYMAPGHVPEYAPGTRLIQFSPTEEAKIVDEAIMRNAQALQGSPDVT